MQRGPQTYLEAAQRLWDATYGELSAAIADESLPRPVRQAANVTVRVKGEFMLPDAPRTEQGAIAKLSTELAAIQGLAIDELNLIGVATKQPAFEAPPRQSVFRAPPLQRKRKRPATLRIVLLVAALLLVLEALARAGAPVPSVGGIVDRLGPDDDPEVEVTPRAQGIGDNFDARPDPMRFMEPARLAAAARHALGVTAQTIGSGKTKHANYANGRLRNQANGKERNQGNGKARNGVIERVATKVRSYASGVARSGTRRSAGSQKIRPRPNWKWKRKR